MARPNNRIDHQKKNRGTFERNRAYIIKHQEVCGICGKPVDKTIPYPQPGSPTVDHIIPVSKGGHPTALENLQLAHFICNRVKSNNTVDYVVSKKEKDIGNRELPHLMDWTQYKG